MSSVDPPIRPAFDREPVRRAFSNGLSALVRGDGPAQVVLLHGALLNAHAWDAVLDDFPVPSIAFDLPGHGESRWLDDGDYSVMRSARIVADSLLEADVSGVLLVGHSRGALIALLAGAIAADRIAGATLIDADPLDASMPATANSLPASGTLVELVEATHTVRPDLSRDRIEDGIRRGAVEVRPGHWRWRWDPQARNAPRTAAERAALADAVRSLEVPLTLVKGGRSDLVTDAGVRRLRRIASVPVRLEVISSSGHNPHSEAPSELAALLRAVV